MRSSAERSRVPAQVDAGRIAARDLSLDQLQRLALFHEPAIDKLLEKHWGKIAPATPGEKLTRIRNVVSAIQAGKGDMAAGKRSFQKHCAICHTLHGEGNKVGPDLTGADRKNREWLVANIVDPSAVIRSEFVAHTVITKDGRVLTGLLAETTPKTVTLLDARNERTILAREH